MTVRLSIFLLLALGTCAFGGPDEPAAVSPTDFLQAFLREQPRFRVSGTFTVSKPGEKPVVCGARLRFDRQLGAAIAYNTTGNDVEPWDFYYWKKSLALFVYDPKRTKVIKAEWLGTPYRPAFNFVWEVLQESRSGPGFRSLLFSGLMRMDLSSRDNFHEINLQRRFGPITVETITFTFDSAYRLVSIHLTETDGTTHDFRTKVFEKLRSKLPRPNIKSTTPLDW